MFKKSILSRSALALGLTLALTPAVFAVGPKLEARFFPVVTGTALSHLNETRAGLSFYVAFEKQRQCEFIAVVWYKNKVRLAVNFEPHAEDMPATRPVGAQYTGPWQVQGLHDLAGSRAHAFHRCHPLWTTITTFYQGDPEARGEEQ